MFKKLFLVLSVCLFITGQSWASQDIKTLVDGITLNDTVTSTNGVDYLGDAEKVGFFVSYDETDATAALSIAVTAQISSDNSNWIDASFLDYAGGVATFVTSETISSDGWYYFWFPQDLTIPYVKIILTPTGHDATHTALVNVYSIRKQ